MFEQYFGPYLVEKNILTLPELETILDQINTARVKLGFLAVAEKFLTQAQADELNRLQATMDCRFGDIAIKKGYLTDEQLTHLLNQQGNSYLKFVQVLIEQNILTYDKLDECLQAYAKAKGFSDDDLKALKSDDVDRVIGVYTKTDQKFVEDYVGLALRTIIRLANNKPVVCGIKKVNSYSCNHLATQNLVGDHHVLVGFGCNNKELLQIAIPFGKEEFTSVDDDALDAICEFINCCNGLYATKLSHEDVRVNMTPPEFYHSKQIKAPKNDIYIVTLKLSNEICDLIVVSDAQYELI